MTYNYVPPNNWTAERVAMLGKLCADGLSSAEIAEELGGITRNAVLGKVHRLGLSLLQQRTGRPRVPNPKRRRNYPNKPKPQHFRVDNRPSEPIVDLPPEIPVNPIPLLDLEHHHCRYPVADNPTLFCGGRAVPGCSWCARHCGVVYQRQPSQSRADRELLVRRMAKMRGAKVA
jgi:GcrA cell cycle regulator